MVAGRHRRAAEAAEAPGAEIGRLEARLEQAEIVHGRHQEGVRHALALGQGDELARLERGHDDEGAGGAHHGGDQGDDAGDVAHRHGDHGSVASFKPHAALVVEGGVADAEVGQHGALGPAGSPGSVKNDGGVLLVDRGGLDHCSACVEQIGEASRRVARRHADAVREGRRRMR